MSPEHVETIIIGGGLSGLYAAYLLSKKQKPFVILEARRRIGGRILSTEHHGFFSDLGPSWYWPEINPRILHLIEILGIEGYRQFEEGLGRFEYPNGRVQTTRGYAAEPASWRLAGGMQALVTKLMERIHPTAIRIASPACEIEKLSRGALVRVGELEKEPIACFNTDKIILAIPPRLAAATILFTPDLSPDLTQAMLRIGTWMAGQAKFYAIYESPGWRQAGLSGQAFSQRGPVGEIHDGSNQDAEPYGLTGFLGIPAAQRRREHSLTEDILAQLASLYGETAARPVTFYYQDWAREKFTATEYDQPPMYEHPVYQPPAGKTSIWDGTLHFAGSETANLHGGYLEGALESAERAVDSL